MICFIIQMLAERQRIEAAPASAPTVDTMPPPPLYEEINGVSTSPVQNGSTDNMGYFLGEVSILKFLVNGINLPNSLNVQQLCFFLGW